MAPAVVGGFDRKKPGMPNAGATRMAKNKSDRTATSDHVRESNPVKVDVEPLQGNVVALSPDRLEAFFADERHQATTQGEEFRRHHHGLLPRPSPGDPH